MHVNLSYTKIGKVVSTHGVKGELYIRHALKNKKELETWKALMVEEYQGSYIPFFIEQCRPSMDQEFICKFEELSNPEEAKMLVNCNVYAPPGKNPDLVVNDNWEFVISYFIYDETSKVKSQIQDVVEIAGQTYFQLYMYDQEVLVPVHESLIAQVDQGSKTITMTLPQGFFDVFR